MIHSSPFVTTSIDATIYWMGSNCPRHAICACSEQKTNAGLGGRVRLADLIGVHFTICTYRGYCTNHRFHVNPVATLIRTDGAVYGRGRFFLSSPPIPNNS